MYFGQREIGKRLLQKLRNDYHHDLRCSPKMILVMKSQEMR
jgi:hypothetical protein